MNGFAGSVVVPVFCVLVPVPGRPSHEWSRRCRPLGRRPRFPAVASRHRPNPGTRRVARVEENTAADSIRLSYDQLGRLSNLTPASGERHDEANMASVDR
jgi:hypothetical protein